MPNSPPPTSPVTGDPANGKMLFFAYSCYACHGYNGETGARRFVGNWGHLATEQEFISFLRGTVQHVGAVEAEDVACTARHEGSQEPWHQSIRLPPAPVKVGEKRVARVAGEELVGALAHLDDLCPVAARRFRDRMLLSAT